jgi:hypothetical protein
MIAALHRQYVADNVMEHGINFLCSVLFRFYALYYLDLLNRNQRSKVYAIYTMPFVMTNINLYGLFRLKS